MPRIPLGYYWYPRARRFLYSTANFRLPTRLSSASPCSISLSLSLHSRFFLVAYLSVFYSPRNLQILRLSRSFVPLSKDRSSTSLVSSSPVAFLSFSLIFFSRCLFSLSFILYSLLYLFLTFLFIPDPPIVLYCRSFTVSLSLSRLPGLARASPRFSATACHAAGRVAQRPDRRVT